MKNPEHSYSLDHNFMRGRCKEHLLLKTANIFLKEVIKVLKIFYLMVKDIFCVIRIVNLETFRWKMALNIKSSK